MRTKRINLGKEILAQLPERINCRGKVREIEGDLVRISLFTGQCEVVGDMSRKYFPKEVKVGAVFDYAAKVDPCQVSVNMVQEREVSPAQIERMRKDIDRRVPDGTY